MARLPACVCVMCVFDEWLLNVSTQEAHNMEPSPFCILFYYCFFGRNACGVCSLEFQPACLEAGLPSDGVMRDPGAVSLAEVLSIVGAVGE